ncbi:MAG: excinuclease ABC subunit UvrA [Chloroflexi bacterium]|nr:excinuclease ABC subunit UvrA [Chloroflexota bacterium]
MPQDKIVVRGAREHNLKNIDVSLPRDKLVVITGLSGSGKSSLAFDTIYAEGQRRYVESLSAYARQFLGRLEKPDVDYIEGLSPAISIDQKGVTHNPRSTVGTVTEIYDYLRLLFARVGRPHCPRCGREISRQTVQQIVDAILGLPEGTRFMIMGPVIKDRKGEHQSVLEDARKAGFVRVRIDGQIHDLSEDFALDKNKKHTVEVVVDRLVIRTENGANPDAGRIADSLETALKLGGGVVLVSIVDGEELLFSEHFACVHCGVSLGEIAPRTFSFNSPHGACPACTGLGTKLEIDPDLVIPNKDLSLSEGAVLPWAKRAIDSAWFSKLLESVAQKYGFSVNAPVSSLSEQQLRLILYGNKGEVFTVRTANKFGRTRDYDTTFEGVVNNLERRYKETDSDYIRAEIERYMSSKPCPVCHGARLKPESLAVTVAGKTIVQATALSISEAIGWLNRLDAHVGGGEEESGWYEARGNGSRPSAAKSAATSPSPLLTERELMIAHQILKEIRSRLGFLMDVGLDYLTLDRAAATLSGGEAQRIRLATQIGSSLMGVLYVCDEPSIGLHPVDGTRLIRTLKKLRDLGNTILIVEHDEAMMRAADYIVDMGPGAGEHGGEVVVAGTLDEIMDCPDSLTGLYLSGRKTIPLPDKRRLPGEKQLVIRGARENNLKNIDVRIPLGLLVCVTGVSGSGKSTLVDDILYRRLAQVLYKAKEKPGQCDGVFGVEHLDKVVNVDQSPIGRTPRSNPATYTGAFTPIRELFASVPEARMRGYAPGRFSFNVKGGRCEACRGEGFVQIEMHFLPDITIPCEVCKGQRYNREALEIRYKGKNIAEVLDMTVEEALGFFEHFPQIRSKLSTLYDVGLSYMRLGQPATTLSGGEAQRVKLATELSKRATGRTLYLLDEPTTGLSFEDVAALLRVLQRLVDTGNTVILIEHHLDLIKNADLIVDLGPGGGDAGGSLIAAGTPEEVASVESSHTGKFLRAILQSEPLTTQAD